MKAPLLTLLLAVAVVGTAAAQTAAPLTLQANVMHAGRIALTLTGPAGAQIDVVESTADVVRPVGHVTLDAEGRAIFAKAGEWACTPRTRSFYAQGTAPDGSAVSGTVETRTPSCANRFSIRTGPRRPRAGKPVTVSLTDRFRLRSRGRVCARGPAELERCAGIFRRAKLTLPRSGRWRVTLRVEGETVRRRITVRRKAGHLRLLATGDSMIQIVDGFFKQRLGPKNVGVRSDARISTGLSKPFLLNWPAHARKQVATYRPDLTIMFIGANDGYAFGSAPCCGRAWQRRYAKAASAMMSTYAQGGKGTVFWCLLPAPRDSRFRKVFVAVNRALKLAVREHPGTVHLVDLPRIFTPGYRYRSSIDGRVVRQDDGVHLNVPGASIGANVMIRALRKAGQL